MLTKSQYALISPTPFVYPDQPGPLIIPDGTTAHANSNMRITHTKEVCLFREVTVVEQDLVQQIVGTVKEAYLVDICNSTTTSINGTMSSVLMHLQDKYGKLMPYKLLEQEAIVKKTIYNPCDPIATVFSAFKELLELSDITGTSYTQLQSVNIFYVILHSMGKFRLATREWDCIPALQKRGCDLNIFLDISPRAERNVQSHC